VPPVGLSLAFVLVVVLGSLAMTVFMPLLPEGTRGPAVIGFVIGIVALAAWAARQMILRRRDGEPTPR
jgi:hypothetical protein